MENSSDTKNLPKLNDLFNRTLSRFQDRFLVYLPMGLSGILLAAPFTYLSHFSNNKHRFTMVMEFFESQGIGVWALLCLLFILLLVTTVLSMWINLAGILAVVGEKESGALDYFKKSKRLLRQFVFFNIKSTLLFLGLLPFGFLSLFTIFIPWMIWPVYSDFIFLDKPEGNLNPLWKSKKMLEGKFLKTLLYLILPSLLFLTLSLVISFKVRGWGAYVWPQVVNLIYGVFTISYIYEMYTSTKVEIALDRADGAGWKNFSIIGFGLLGLLSVIIVVVNLIG